MEEQSIPEQTTSFIIERSSPHHNKVLADGPHYKPLNREYRSDEYRIGKLKAF